MFVASLLLLALLLPINCFGPGFFFVRRLSWSAGEKVCASVGLSCLLLYLAATAIYLLGLGPAWNYAVSGLCLLLTAAAAPDLRRLARQAHARALFGGFALLLLWGLLLLALVRHYSGDDWAGDWYEHYERALFFLHRRPADHRFLGISLLPARPPFMNLLAAHFLAQAGEDFTNFQIAFLFMNLLVVLPCLLLPVLLLPGGRRRLPVVLAFLALSPLLLQNVTYTWTKLFAALYVLLGLVLYLRAWSGRDSVRLVWAAGCLGCALLVHYSAAPYVLFLGLHYLVLWRGRPQRWREAAAAGLVVVVLLASWLSWSVARYGLGTTFGSNTTVTDSSQLSLAQNARKVVDNLYYSVVPYPLRGLDEEVWAHYDQPNPLGRVRDYWFLLYQKNLLLGFGLGGWLLVALLLQEAATLPGSTRPALWFWAGFLLFTLVLGIAVHGTAEVYGVPHICLQPLVLLGLTLLGAGYHLLPRWLRAPAVLLCVADFFLGIYLQFRAESYFFRVVSVTAQGDQLASSKEMLSEVALGNFLLRHTAGLGFFGDPFTAVQGWLRGAMLLGLALWLWPLCRAALPGRGAARWQRRLLYGAALATAAGFLIYCTRLEPRNAAPQQPLKQAGSLYPGARAASRRAAGEPSATREEG